MPCGSRIELVLIRRPGNALNIEIGQGVPRCLNKRPSNWPAEASSLRWIGSGGEPTVFGACTPNKCPERPSCACQSEDARRCYVLRYDLDDEDDNDAMDCECVCHRDSEEALS